MRRVLLFAAFLLLLGLTTATAASFDVQAEDITSFSQPVSILVEPEYLYIREPCPGANPPSALGCGPGVLSTTTGTDQSLYSERVLRTTSSLAAEVGPGFHVQWQTEAGIALDLSSKVVKVYLFRNGGSGPITTGLYSCPSPTALTTACDPLLTSDQTVTVDDEEVVSLGTTNSEVTIGTTEVLRLKVVNKTSLAPGQGSDWNLQWGYKTNRRARIEFTELVS